MSRNADINIYLDAKDEMIKKYKAKDYLLNTNWRSTSKLINDFNKLFSHHEVTQGTNKSDIRSGEMVELLREQDAHGMIHLEFSNSPLKTNLEKAHHQYTTKGTGFQFLKRIVESCHFVFGPNNNFTQVADLFINAAYLKYEKNNSVYFEKYLPYIDTDDTKNIIGCGIKYFP